MLLIMRQLEVNWKISKLECWVTLYVEPVDGFMFHYRNPEATILMHNNFNNNSFIIPLVYVIHTNTKATILIECGILHQSGNITII